MIKKYRIPIVLMYYLLVMIVLSSLPITVNIMNFVARGNVEKAIKYLIMFFYCSHFILFVVCYLFFREEIKEKGKEFLLNWKKNFKYIIVGFIMIIIANVVIGIFLKQQGSNQEALSSMQEGTKSFMLLCFYLVTVVIGPINEEFVFRRMILGEGRKYVSTGIALILSSLLFGLIHVHSIKEIMLVIPYLFTGIVLGFLYYKSDNIVTSSCLHIVNNLFGVILLAIV